MTSTREAIALPNFLSLGEQLCKMPPKNVSHQQEKTDDGAFHHNESMAK